MKTGVIGLGAMGANMARNLAAKKRLKMVYNRTVSKSEDIAKECACTIARSPAALAADCEMIILCVSRDEDVLQIINTIKGHVQADTIVIDTSTVSANTAKQAANLLREVNAYFLDCPVSGGVEGAKRGTLAMMVGGDKAILDKARPTLMSIANNIVYLGGSGSGQATKAVNQLMAAGINQAVTEALAFGQAMGLPMDKVIDVVSAGAAGNWFLSHRGKTMLAENYKPGFKLALHHKDLLICQAMLESIAHHAIPIMDSTLSAYECLIEQGYGDEDISALFRLKQKMQDK